MNSSEKTIKALLPKVRTSKGELVEFDELKIIKSIEEETGLANEDSKKVTVETIRQLIKFGIPFLATPQIREWVCVVLEQLGYITERKKYTRRGMSSAEIEELQPRSQRIKNQIKTLQFLGIWYGQNVGRFAYNTLKDHYALTDPFFQVIWDYSRFLISFKNMIKKI